MASREALGNFFPSSSKFPHNSARDSWYIFGDNVNNAIQQWNDFFLWKLPKPR